MTESATLTVRSSTEAIDEARLWLSGHLRAGGASADAVWALELALTEALSNVARHAYGGDATRTVELALRLSDERVELDIVHFGVPFDPEAYQPPALERPSGSGYGVHLMGELMDDVVRTQIGPAACLRLVKCRWKDQK